MAHCCFDGCAGASEFACDPEYFFSGEEFAAEVFAVAEEGVVLPGHGCSPGAGMSYSSLAFPSERTGGVAIASAPANAGRRVRAPPEVKRDILRIFHDVRMLGFFSFVLSSKGRIFEKLRRRESAVQRLSEGFSPKRRAIRRLESAVAAAITTHEVGRGARLCRATAASPPGSGRDESDDTQTQATRGFAFLFSSCPRRRFRLR